MGEIDGHVEDKSVSAKKKPEAMRPTTRSSGEPTPRRGNVGQLRQLLQVDQHLPTMRRTLSAADAKKHLADAGPRAATWRLQAHEITTEFGHAADVPIHPVFRSPPFGGTWRIGARRPPRAFWWTPTCRSGQNRSPGWLQRLGGPFSRLQEAGTDQTRGPEQAPSPYGGSEGDFRSPAGSRAVNGDVRWRRYERSAPEVAKGRKEIEMVGCHRWQGLEQRKKGRLPPVARARTKEERSAATGGRGSNKGRKVGCHRWQRACHRKKSALPRRLFASPRKNWASERTGPRERRAGKASPAGRRCREGRNGLLSKPARVRGGQVRLLRRAERSRDPTADLA